MFNVDQDLSAAEEGVWAPWQGSDFLIAHISNLKFQRALARLQQPHRRKIESGQLDPKIHREVLAKAMAEAVLLNWRNVKSNAGPVEYSPEAAVKALARDPEFRDFVTEFATNMANFRDAEVEEMGND